LSSWLSAHHNSNIFIYLTFDDGPLNGSQHINDVVLSEKIPVTFMLVGKHATVRPHDVQLYRNNPYIEIGNHSYTHANDQYAAYYSNPEGVLADFMRNMDSLQLTTKVGRLPGRNMWRVNQRSRNDISSGIEAADLLHRNGYSLYGWDLEWMHDPHTAEPVGTADEIFSQIQKAIEQNRVFTSNHFVLLYNDEMFQNGYEESELKKLVELSEANDKYQLAQINDYP
jgi:hypothetical protein